MSDCRKYDELLEAYNQGFLDESARRELEIHLLECETCNLKAREGAQVTLLMHLDPDVRKVVSDLAEKPEISSALKEAVPKSIFGRFSKYMPAAALALILLVFLILKPWRLEFSLDEEAVAQPNLLAIMCFENLADPDDEQRLGPVLSNLLISDLSESSYFKVLSNERLFDTRRVLGEDEKDVVSSESALKIARSANARWLLTGQILQAEPSFIVVSHMVEVFSGQVVASDKISGRPGDDIFSLADDLSARIKRDLPLPDSAYLEVDPPVVEITTNSLDAYRAFLAGVEYFQKYQWQKAQVLLYEALSYDSTCAAAYYYLSLIRPYPESRILIEKGRTYSDNCAEKDRLLINAQFAFLHDDIRTTLLELSLLTKMYPEEKYPHFKMAQLAPKFITSQQAMGHLQRAVAIDPLYKNAYNLMGYVYYYMGDKKQSLAAIDKYIQMAPEEPNPYDSKADILARFGDHDEAMGLYRMVLGKDPDFRNALEKMALLSLFRRDYSVADSLYRLSAFLDRPDSLASIKYFEGCGLISLGRLGKAVSILNEGLEMAKPVQIGNLRWEDGIGGLMQWLGLRISGYYKDSPAVLKEIENTSVIKESYYTQYGFNFLLLHVEYLARTGNYERAAKITDGVKTYYDKNGIPLERYWLSAGVIEYYHGDFTKALNYLSQIHPGEDRLDYFAVYMLGRTYLELGRFEEAESEFHRVIDDYGLWRPYWVDIQTLAHYYLAEVYDKTGRKEKAGREYRKFLEYWGGSVSDLEEIKLARAKLAGS